jgi:hypothetical protein
MVAFDVAARLAEGMPAIADFETYAWAARAVGYQNADLTSHAGQIRDLYGTEEGLDLAALEGNASALSKLASVAAEALRVEAGAMTELAVAWEGQAAAAAREFLGRQHNTAATVGAAVGAAATALTALRDELWRAVDAKVEAVAAIDGRSGPRRAEWLAAAHTVLTGSGDRSAASEVVDQRVRPFVEHDMGSDWVSAMRASTAAARAAYDAAIAAVKPDQSISFDVPGFVGPTWHQPHDDQPVVDRPAAPPAAVQTMPAAAVTPSPTALPSPQPTSSPVQPATAPALPSAAPPASQPPMPGLGDFGGMPGLGGGLPAMASGLPGLGRQLSDGIAGLTGAGRDALTDEPKEVEKDPVKDPKDDEELDDEDDDKKRVGEEKDNLDEESDGGEQPPAETKGEEPKAATDTPPPVPTPLPEPPPTDVAPQPLPARTPCEIAADEVPQVGE